MLESPELSTSSTWKVIAVVLIEAEAKTAALAAEVAFTTAVSVARLAAVTGTVTCTATSTAEPGLIVAVCVICEVCAAFQKTTGQAFPDFVRLYLSAA